MADIEIAVSIVWNRDENVAKIDGVTPRCSYHTAAGQNN